MSFQLSTGIECCRCFQSHRDEMVFHVEHWGAHIFV